jgi:hypothetical protein
LGGEKKVEGELKRGEASLTKPIPPLLEKERGIKGVRLIKNIYRSQYSWTLII